MSPKQKKRQKLLAQKRHTQALELKKLDKLNKKLNKMSFDDSLPKTKNPKMKKDSDVVFRSNIIYPSAIMSAPEKLPKISKFNEEMNEEMKKREKLAQKEVERRKKCSAPAYNKGAYQPVFSIEEAKFIGK